MKPSDFRCLIAAHVALVLVTFGVNAYEIETVSPEVAFAQATFSAAFADSWVYRSMSFNLVLIGILLLATLAAWTGLFLFKSWGRRLSLYITIAAVAASPLFPPVPVLPLEHALTGATSIVWGAVLAAAYWSPVAAQFCANISFKPTSLRDAA